jgi:hypothetical protein
MSRNRMEVDPQSVGSESRYTVRMQERLEFMNQLGSIDCAASAKMQGRESFAHRINRQPKSAGFLFVFHLGVQFIHLDEIEAEIGERLGMPLRAMLTCPIKPLSQRFLVIPESAYQHLDINPFGPPP